MSLSEYRKKRNFRVTPEPSGGPPAEEISRLIFVIQKHLSSHLHYDFRLEWNGILLSWAVPKGPSLSSSVKRLAMRVEDHPVEYANFEGVIPEGEYGAGTVMVWDKGTWEPEIPDVDAALKEGELKFTLLGKKLKGSWVLVHTPGYSSTRHSAWLLIKHEDRYASKRDITLDEPYSVLTHRLLADIARDGGGDVKKAASGDPSADRAVRASSTKAASVSARKRQP